MATWLDIVYIHYVVRSDGAKWVNGQRDDTADTSWVDMTGGVLTLQAGVYDELLILPYVASEEGIRAWYELGAPFYDAAENVGIDTPEGNVIEIGRRGILITPAGFPQRGAHLDGRTLGFWDINNVPAIGIGDVREMAAQLGSSMEYGLLLNQGEIRANQAVLGKSLSDGGTTSEKLADGSVTLPKLAPLAISLPGSGHVPIYGNNTKKTITTSNSLLYSHTFTRQRPDGSIIDTLTVRMRAFVTGWDGRDNSVYAIFTFRINGVNIATFVFGREISGGVVAQADGDIEFDIDVTNYGLQTNLTFEVYAYVTGPAPSKGGRVFGLGLYKQDDIPIVARTPSFARQYTQCDYMCQLSCETSCQNVCQNSCQSSCQLSCQTACESGCQSSCQTSCQTSCEVECQTGCQVSCQSTCETTSQGGGGCIREGTPVTIWDPEEKAYREIPVEELRPGMILPGYNPETDSIDHGELIELQDAKYSSTFLRIHTDGGPSVDVTWEQPFDVMADFGQGWMWYRLPAKYLKPGMKMVRPFDDPEKRLVTITNVEMVKEYRVHFWNPKTSHGRFIVAGYGDFRTKLPLLPY